MSTIEPFCFATKIHKFLFGNLPQTLCGSKYQLKNGKNPYWIWTIRTRWHVCAVDAVIGLAVGAVVLLIAVMFVACVIFARQK